MSLEGLSLEGFDLRALGAAVALFACIALGYVVRSVALRRLKRLSSLTDSRLDDELVESLRRPLPLWFALLGLYLASSVMQLPSEWSQRAALAVLALWIVSLSLWAADLAVRMLALGTSRGAAGAWAATGVVKNVVRLTVLAVGALVLLNTLGISVLPVLTTIGIGGIAVALGLQDTLANLFAGVHVTLAGNVRAGDFVRLDSGEEGYVVDIRWRSTSIRTLPNNLVIVPNARFAQSIVTNYSLPSSELAVLVDVGVHYASDLEQVERVTCEVAAETLRAVKGGVADFAPFIRFNHFGAHSIDFTVILRAHEFTDNYLVKHEFIKRLASRYAREGIVIPFPISALNVAQERVAESLGLPKPVAHG